MHGGVVPVLHIGPVLVPVKVQLVEPEYYREALRLPELLVRVEIFHPEAPHDGPAAGVVDVVRGGDIRYAEAPQPPDDGRRGLRGDAAALEFPPEAVAEVAAGRGGNRDVPYRDVVRLEADGVAEPLRAGREALVIENPGLLRRFQGESGQETVHFLVAENFEQRAEVAL